MLFHSTTFLFFFLPITLFLHRISTRSTNGSQSYPIFPRIILIASTFIFYGWIEPWWLLPFAINVGFDFFWATLLSRTEGTTRKWICGISIAQNLLLLGFFKYWDPFVNHFVAWNPSLARFIAPHHLSLPAGISFYTFESLSFVIDIYRRNISCPKNPLDFFGFIAMFPRFIAGPIVRYREIVPQIHHYRGMQLDRGVLIFVRGLFLKTCLADSFAVFTNYAFADHFTLDAVSAWVGVIAYSMQIYFDFSGYSMMAIGLGLAFGFQFPENFNRPYLSGSLRDFWNRWHISLSHWLRDYIYIPLGGSRNNATHTYFNIFVTFFLGGIWHGAGVNFAVWGLWHATGLCLEHALGWRDTKTGFVHRLRTLLWIMIGWVFFRADTLPKAFAILSALTDFSFLDLNFNIEGIESNPVATAFALAGFFYCFVIEPIEAKNPLFEGNRDFSLFELLSGVATLALTLLFGFSQFTVPFLYFRF